MTSGPDGVLVVDKPSGPTSHDVVQVARRKLGSRVGHTGTLDPLASGVLPLVVGSATRLARFMSGAEKVYEATIVFGRETDTYDAAGQTTRETGAPPDLVALAAAIAGLPGRRLQTPPAYSAKKIGGEAAHRLARRATPVVPAAVEVEVHDAVLVAVAGLAARLRLRVSAGFYVRSLAHDLGATLAVGAHLGELRRLSSGPFDLGAATTWETVVAGGPALHSAVVPPERLLLHLPPVPLSDPDVVRLRQGQQVAASGDPRLAAATLPIRLLDPAGRLVGVGAVVPGGPGDDRVFLQPVVILR